MVRSRLYVGAQTPAEGAVRTIGFIILFSLCLLAETLFVSPAGPQAQAVSCAGALIGMMTITHPRWWGNMILMALLLRFGFELATSLGDVAFSLWRSMSIVFLSAATAALPVLMIRRRRRDLLTSELLGPTAIALALSATAFGLTSALLDPAVARDGVSIATSAMSFFVGGSIIAAWFVCFGLPFGLPTGPNLVQWVSVVVATLLFQLGVSIGFNHYPQIIAQWLGAEFAVVWLAIPALCWLTMVASGGVVALNLIGMLLMASISWSFELGHFADKESLLLLLEWQGAVTGLTFVGLAGAAVAANLRYSQQKQRIQADIAEKLLATESQGADDRVSDTMKQMLEKAARFCGADECRLYVFANDRQQLNEVYAWEKHEPSQASPITVATANVVWFDKQISSGRPVFYRHTVHRHGDRPKILEVLGLPNNVEIYAVPVGMSETVACVIMLICYEQRGLALRDALPLLSGIGSFFAREQSRRRAERDMRGYERRLRDLTTSLTESDERVRRHTSVDLHDGLIQQLAVARMKLGELRYRRVSAPDTVEKITAIVDDTLATTRRIVHELSPSVLYELGLGPGIQSLCDDATERGPIPAEMIEEGERQYMPEPLMVSLYEVVRELIDNSQRHSGGSMIWVKVVWGDVALRNITVSDDGIHDQWWSAAEQNTGSGGLGLLSNSERLRSFGFTTLFGPRAGGGTTANVIAEPSKTRAGSAALRVSRRFGI
ncbi:MAG: histidine kinase [Pseudomonadota bacterium]